MIQGKTASLVGACVSIGKRSGQCLRRGLRVTATGRAVGMSFQFVTTFLAFWGDPAVTGKPAGNDVLRRKKSFPMLYTLNHPGLGEQFETLLGEISLPTSCPTLEILERVVPARKPSARLKAGIKPASRAATSAGQDATDSALWALAESLLSSRVSSISQSLV